MPASLEFFSCSVSTNYNVENAILRGMMFCQTILSPLCFHREFILNHRQQFNNHKQRSQCLNYTFLFWHKGEAALNLLAFVQLYRSIWVQSECWIDTFCHIEGKMPRVHTMGITVICYHTNRVIQYWLFVLRNRVVRFFIDVQLIQ